MMPAKGDCGSGYPRSRPAAMALKPDTIAITVPYELDGEQIKARDQPDLVAPISTSEPISVASEPAPDPTCGTIDSQRCANSARLTATAMNSLTCIGTRALESPGISMKHAPIRQKARKIARIAVSTVHRLRSWPLSRGWAPMLQEMVPSTLTSTPRAISTWLSTGRVGNSRSTTMRT